MSSEEVFSKKKTLKEFPYKSAQKKGKHKVCFETLNTLDFKTLNPKNGGSFFSLSFIIRNKGTFGDADFFLSFCALINGTFSLLYTYEHISSLTQRHKSTYIETLLQRDEKPKNSFLSSFCLREEQLVFFCEEDEYYCCGQLFGVANDEDVVEDIFDFGDAFGKRRTTSSSSKSPPSLSSFTSPRGGRRFDDDDDVVVRDARFGDEYYRFDERRRGREDFITKEEEEEEFCVVYAAGTVTFGSFDRSGEKSERVHRRFRGVCDR